MPVSKCLFLPSLQEPEPADNELKPPREDVDPLDLAIGKSGQ